MTRKEQQRRWKALAGVRGAIHGFAFARIEAIPGYISYAESERDKLPFEFHDEANALIQPVRNRLGQESK